MSEKGQYLTVVETRQVVAAMELLQKLNHGDVISFGPMPVFDANGESCGVIAWNRDCDDWCWYPGGVSDE